MSTPYTTYTSNCDKVDVRFTTHYDVSNVRHVIGVTGSCKYLGSWDPKHALLLERRGTKGCLSSVVKLPLSQYFEWKLMVIDRETLAIRKWEESPNRWNWIDRGPVEIIVGWNSKELIRCSSCRCLVGTCRCTTIYSHLAPFESLVDVTFRVIYSIDTDDETIALIGSSKFLGDWDPTISRLFPEHNNPVLTIQLPMNTCFEWKLAILDKRHRKVVRWEECENRALKLQTCPLEVGVAWSQVAEIGYKCYWLDPHWAVSPCPCGRRYCCNTDIGDRGQITNPLSNTLETPKKTLVCKPALRIEPGKDDQDRPSEKHEKSVHFPENPVTQVIERGENPDTSSADSLQELHIELDSLGLDEMSYNNCLAIRHQTQVLTTCKNQVNDDESSGTEKQTDERNISLQTKKQTSDSNSFQLKQLRPEQQTENGDSQHGRQQDKKSDKSDLSHPEKQRSNDDNVSQSENVEPIDPSVDKLGTKELTNDTALPENLNLKTQPDTCSHKVTSSKILADISCGDLLEPLKQPKKLSKSVSLSPPTPISCGDLPLPAKQPQNSSKSSNLSVTTFQSEKLELSLPEKQKLFSCEDLSMPAKQPNKTVKKIKAKQPEKLGSSGHLTLTAWKPKQPFESGDLSLPAKKPEKPFESGDLSLLVKKPEDPSKSVDLSVPAKKPKDPSKRNDLSLPAKQPDQISENRSLTLQEELSKRVVLYLPAKQQDTLASYGDNSLQTKQTEELLSCRNLSLPEKLPKELSRSFDSSQPAKQPCKLSSTSDYSLQTKQPENLVSFKEPTLAKQPKTLPENGNLSPPLKQPRKSSKSGNLSLTAKKPKEISRSVKLSLPAKQPKKISESVNSSLPAIQHESISKSVKVSLPAKQSDKLVSSGNSPLPAKKPGGLSKRKIVELSLPAKQPHKLDSSGNSSLQAKQPEVFSKSVKLSLPAKQPHTLVSSGNSQQPEKQPEKLSESVVIFIPARQLDKVVSSDNSSLPAKQPGGLSKSVELSLPAKQSDKLASGGNSSLPVKQSAEELFESGQITLPAKQPKDVISCGDLLQLNEERDNSIVQEQANSNFSTALFLTASSALALIIAGYRYLR